jgi:hypothetical protein
MIYVISVSIYIYIINTNQPTNQPTYLPDDITPLHSVLININVSGNGILLDNDSVYFKNHESSTRHSKGFEQYIATAAPRDTPKVIFHILKNPPSMTFTGQKTKRQLVAHGN